MNRLIIAYMYAAALCAMPLCSHARDVVWSCPDGDFASQAIISGDVQNWPNFSPGPGMRVQKQHPNTALSAQAKHIQSNGKTGAVCQYYNHVGYVFTIIAIGAKKYQLAEGSYWRKDYTESSPQNDNVNNLMTDVCMRDKEGKAHLSNGCSFAVPENG